jgi:hypothetical protein
MANTIDADLLCDTLGNGVIDILSNRLAPFRAMSREFSADGIQQTKSVQLVKVTAGSTTLKNPTSFNSGDSTTSNIAVTVDHYSQPFHVTSKELNQKMALLNLATANAEALGLTISKVWTALVLSATFTNTAVTVAQASFAAANAKSLLGSIMKCREQHLIIDGVAYAQLAPSDKNAYSLGESGAYGFKGIHCQTDWTGATANTYGIACGPEAFAVYANLPLMHEGVRSALIEQRSIVLEKLGLTVQLNIWIDVNTRAIWASYDLMFGVAVANINAATMLLSA